MGQQGSKSQTDAFNPPVRRQILARGICDDNIVRGIGFAVRAGRTKDKVVPLSLILVRLMPRVEANNSGKILRVKMVYQH